MKPSERIKELRVEIEWPGNGNLKFAVENIKAIIDYLDEQYEAEHATTTKDYPITSTISSA